MNTTVLVALITSISTLSAGLIAGIISWLIQKRQLVAQTELASAERVEQYRQNRIDTQKQAYIQFMNSFDDAERLVQNCWLERGVGDEKMPVSDAWRAAFGALFDLEHMINLVAMEGPGEVTKEAMRLYNVLKDELSHVTSISHKEENDGLVLMTSMNGEYKNYLTTRRNTRTNFIDTAHRAIYPLN